MNIEFGQGKRPTRYDSPLVSAYGSGPIGARCASCKQLVRVLVSGGRAGSRPRTRCELAPAMAITGEKHACGRFEEGRSG